MKKINLFVIDELPIIQKISTTLHSEDLGISVLDIALTEEEALQKIKDIKHIDVLLTRPIESNTLTAIKQQFPKIKVIGMIEKSQIHVQIKADVWIKKPFKLRYLIETIEKVTEKEVEKEQFIDQQFKALSDATRRKILDALQEKTLTAGELAELCQTTKPNISQHLKMLKNSGLVQEEKKGLYVHYSLSRFDFQQAKKEVGQMLNIKEKILYDFQQIAYKKNCEPVVGATDSQDDGTFYIMKDTETLISFHYSFRLTSFFVNFEIPVYLQQGGSFHLRYDDTKAIEDLYASITYELQQYVLKEEKKKETHEKIRYEVKKYMIEKTRNMDIFLTKDEKLLHQLQEWATQHIKEKTEELTLTEQQDIVRQTISELTSLGKIHPLLEDALIAEIMINAPDDVWVEKCGRLTKTAIQFADHDEVMHLARKIAGLSGRRIDNTRPILHTKLPDGSSVQIILPPIMARGINIVIRKFHQEKLSIDDIIKFDTISKEAADFLQKAVAAKANILISGSAGAGKTTSLNILSQMIPNDERIITIEDNLELQLPQDHVVPMETRPANAEGVGEISLRDCLKAARKLRPDRFVFGEIRDGIAHDIVQACLTGHAGTMASIHANNARDALERMTNFVTYAGYDHPIHVIQQSIGDAVDLIVQIHRLKDGSRKFTEITQVIGYNRVDKDFIVQPIYTWGEKGKQNGKICGDIVYTGYDLSEKLREKFELHNIDNPLTHLSKTGTEKEITTIETALPVFTEQLADALRSGFALNEAVRYLDETNPTLLTEAFYTAVKKNETGMTRLRAFHELEEQYDSPQWRFLLRAISLQEEIEGPMELLLRRVQTVLLERNDILQHKSNEEKKEIITQDAWQFVEFLDLLSCITPATHSLQQSIHYVYKYLDNRFSKRFYEAVKENEAGKGMEQAYTDAAIHLNTQETLSFVTQINHAKALGMSWDKAVQNEAVKWRNLLKSRLKGD